MRFHDDLRPAGRDAPPSGISEIIAHGWRRGGVIPLWAGEGDLPTPDFISEPASAALAAGRTFYTWQRGIPALREALARYHERHFGRVFEAGEFIVTGSGMHAIVMALQALAGVGDEIVYLSPAWPNLAAAAGVAGAKPVPVTLELSGNGWSLDLGRLEAAITPATRAIFVNSPSNPTGWTASREELAAILHIARSRGVWIIADEIYALFHYDAGRAPSFFDLVEAEDRVIFVNSFSKNWAMTGWRVGWLRVHPELEQMFENLVQYTNSGVPEFLQHGAVAALDLGDAFIFGQVERARQARDFVCSALAATGRTRFAVPQGAFYLFVGIDGVADARSAAFDLVDEAGVGLAPGTAFGPGGAGFLRLCFHRRMDEIEDAATRIVDWIGRLQRD